VYVYAIDEYRIISQCDPRADPPPRDDPSRQLAYVCSL
jgi:hypothetical protein